MKRHLLFIGGVLLCFSIATVYAVLPVTNWKDYIAPEMLEKYTGKQFEGFNKSHFQGDISGIDPDVPESDLKSGLNNAINDVSKRWKDGTVPYTLSSMYDGDERSLERQTIRFAMGQLSASTKNCIKFVPRTNEDDYIHIIRGTSCSSDVGRNGGKQLVSYTRGCLEDIGAIQHELMHALGFYHEHSRADRDKYVWIQWDNLLPDYVKDFTIKTDALVFGMPYDYNSILHYPFNAFAINTSSPTIIPKEKASGIGQRDGLSFLDTIKLNKAYNCPAMGEIDQVLSVTHTTMTPFTTTKAPCSDPEIQCYNSVKCIRRKDICDGVWDCSDGSDETDSTCSKFGVTRSTTTTLAPVTRAPCPIQCSDSTKCITYKDICDGIPDCPNESDELDASCVKFGVTRVRFTLRADGYTYWTHPSWYNGQDKERGRVSVFRYQSGDVDLWGIAVEKIDEYWRLYEYTRTWNTTRNGWWIKTECCKIASIIGERVETLGEHDLSDVYHAAQQAHNDGGSDFKTYNSRQWTSRVKLILGH